MGSFFRFCLTQCRNINKCQCNNLQSVNFQVFWFVNLPFKNFSNLVKKNRFFAYSFNLCVNPKQQPASFLYCLRVACCCRCLKRRRTVPKMAGKKYTLCALMEQVKRLLTRHYYMLLLRSNAHTSSSSRD